MLADVWRSQRHTVDRSRRRCLHPRPSPPHDRPDAAPRADPAGGRRSGGGRDPVRRRARLRRASGSRERARPSPSRRRELWPGPRDGASLSSARCAAPRVTRRICPARKRRCGRRACCWRRATPRRSGWRHGSQRARGRSRADESAAPGGAPGRERRPAGVRRGDPDGGRHGHASRMGAARPGRPASGAPARGPDPSPGRRGRQPAGVRGLSVGAAGARRDRAGARGRAGDGRADDPAFGAADPVGADVRPDAGRDHRRHPVRGLGAEPCGGDGAGRARRGRLRAVPPPSGGRAHGRGDQPLDAGVDRARPRARQPGVLQPQRRARQGAALRRQQPGGDRPAEMDGRGAGANARRGARRPRRRGAQAADGPGAAHGRRGAQPERRSLGAAAQAPGAGAAAHRHGRPPTSPPSRSSSPATTISSSTSRWRRARPCSTPLPASRAAAW